MSISMRIIIRSIERWSVEAAFPDIVRFLPIQSHARIRRMLIGDKELAMNLMERSVVKPRRARRWSMQDRASIEMAQLHAADGTHRIC
jgi:hypothetical protein